MPIIAGQSDFDTPERARRRAEEEDARLDAIYAPLVARDIAGRDADTFLRPRQASVAADAMGNVQGAAPVANRNGWPVGVVASDPARFAAEDRRRRLDAVTDPDTSRYLSDPTRNALVGDDIEATNTLGASIKRLLRNTTTSLVSGLTAGQYDHPENVTNYLAGIGTPRTAGHDLWLTVKQSARRTDAAVLEAPFTLGDAVINPWQVRATSALLSQLSDRFNVPARSIPRPDAIRGTQAELYRTNADEYQAEASGAKIRRDRSRSSTFTGVLGDYWDHPQLAAEDALGSTVAMGLGGAGLGPLTIPALAATQASDAQLQIKQTLQQRNPGMSEAELDSRAAEVAPLLVGAGLVFPQASHGAGLIENFMSGQFRRNAERAVARNAVDFGVRATARRVVGNVGAEVLSEMGEEGTIQLGQNVATGDPVFHGVGGAMASGAVLATGMSGPIAGYEEHAMRVADARRRAAIDYVANAIGSASDVNNLVALTRAAASAKLTEVDPAEAAAFAREHMGGTDVTVYVPVAEVTALYQDEAEQRAAFEALTDGPQAVLDAQVTGEIAVPPDRWVSRVARLPRAEELAGVAKLAPGALSNKELQAFTPEQIQEDLARYYAEAAEDSERRSGPEGEVYDSVYGDLLPHYGPEGAGRVAATLQSFYRTMGARVGVDAKTLFDRFRINIGGKRRGNPGVVPRDVDTTLDPMIDAAINGKAFSDDEIHGNAGGVISAILAAGGIRPDSVGADDLRSLQSLPPGFFNANGRTAEAMAEALAEDGWRGSFADVDSYGRPGANELYDLVRREVFGDKVRPDMDGADQDRAAKREAINNDIATVRDAFKRYEAETGVDPATLPREQQREIALGGLNALDQGAAPEDVLESDGFRRWFGDRSIEQLEADYAALTDEDGNNRTDDGHKIDTDLVRELSPDYVADRSRSQELHPYASALTKELFRRALARPVREGKSPVVAFLAGGGGSGKSTAASDTLVAVNADITLDGTLSNLAGAQKNITAALASGRAATVVFVYRSPAKSVDGAISRAISAGRPVPVWALAEAHAKAPQVVKNLARAYHGDDRVGVVAIWNDGAKEEAHTIPVEEVPDVDQDEAEQIFREAVESAGRDGRAGEKLVAAFLAPKDRGRDGAKSQTRTGQDALTQDPAAGGVSDSGAALNQSSDDGFSEEGRKQFRETERAYGGREGYERDKAAGRTKLTYGQWVQVRTPAFLEWFGDWMNDPANASKVVDPKTGEPLVVYHGTPNASFVSFKDGAHFTEDADYAAVYMHPSASSINAEEKRADAAAIYPVYLAIQHPFDTRDPAIRAVFDREFFGKWGNATPLTDRGLPDWTDSRDLLEWIEETDQPFDGLILDEGGTPEGGHRGFSYVSVKPAQIKSATANNGDFSENPNILKQADGNKKAPRGQIVGRDGQSIIGQKAEDGSRDFNITLFEGKDLSTVLHEAGHAFFEIFGDLAEDANASEQLKADYSALLAWAKVKDRSEVGRAQHEQFARGFEAYAREGKAPSPALRRAFAMFGTFLTRIYKVLSALNVNLTPEVRGVFDRMLASEEEIAEAQRAQSMEPLLREFDGWTPEQKAAYEAAVIEARGEAERRLAAEVLRNQQRAEKAWQGEERKKVQKQVEADTRALPVYRAIRWLRNGKLPDGSEVPAKLKLSKQLLLDDYGPEILKSLRGLYSKDGGDSADSVAAALGFPSGREMIDQIVKAPPLQDVIKADTDNIMAERYPDPMNDGSMAERAQNKVHSSKQRELMLMEINALERRAGRPPTQMQIMREAVKRILGGRPARTIAPGGYRAAEAKYGRMAFDALAKGDHAGALEARRQQMLNSLLYSEATKIRAEVEKAGKLFNRYTKKRTRAKVGKVGGTYLEQIDALLERFDFRQVSGPQSERRMALRDWIDARLADGLPADFPKRLMDDAYRTPYKDMTVDQIRELRDAVVSIAYWASMKGKLLLAGELRSRKAIDSQMEASVLAGSKAQPDVPGHVDDSAFMKLWGELRRHIAAVTDMARRLDGYVDLGAVWTNTVGVIRDAVSNNLNPALRQARETIAKLYLDNYTRSEIAHFKDLRTIQGVRGVWSRENILAVALNWGNEENRLAILTQERGRPTPEEVERLLQTLTPKDWDFVEGVWQAIDAYWPQIAAAQRRRKGLAPKKVEASSFVVTLPDGTQRTIRGGYYPLKFAGSLHSDANEAEDFFKSVQSGTFSSVSTRDGHTQERVGSAGQSPRLDLGVIDQHMRGVLYDLHMGDAVNYVHRVLRGSRFKRAVEDTGHRELLHGMEDWLRDVATGEMPVHGYEAGIRFLRQNFTAAVLGFKATTAFLQVTGALTTSRVLGNKATLAGISRYKSGAIAMTKYVREQSAYMDQRVGTTVDVVRELSSARDGALKRAYDWQMRWAYVCIGFFQQIVDVQAWLGAESKGLEMFDGDIKKARAYADDIVSRSQGSQEWMDKNSLQRGTVGKKIKQAEVIRAFTTLGGYMIVKHNAIVEQVTKAKGDVTGINLKSVGVGLNLALNLCILTYADALVSGLIRGDLPDDDDDDEFMKKWFEFFAGEGFASLAGAIPGIGALVSKAKGYDVESVTVNLWGDVVKAWDQAWQGEADMALARSLVTVAGDVTGIPASQINATLRAVEASDDGRDVSPIDYLRGPPRH